MAAPHTTHLAIGYRVKAYDRNNIGTIEAYNDHTGTVSIERSVLEDNPSHKFETPGLPGMFVIARQWPTIVASTLR